MGTYGMLALQLNPEFIRYISKFEILGMRSKTNVVGKYSTTSMSNNLNRTQRS